MKQLVGQGKPFHSALDRAAGLLKRKVGTGSEFLKELMSIPGVKQAEIAERDLGDLLNAPKMTHEQFMSALGSKPAPAILEKVLGEAPEPADVLRRANAHARTSASNYAQSADTSREAREMRADELRRIRENHRPEMFRYARHELEGENPTYHGQYTLPGGENYREMLIKAPKSDKYWAQKYDGERVFFDDPDEASRHAGSSGQAGRIEGATGGFGGVNAHFGGEGDILASMRLKDRAGPNGEKLLHLEELQSDWHQQGREKGYHDPEKTAQAEAKIKALKAEHKRLGEVKALAQTPEEREAISEQRLAIMGQIRDATIMPSDHVPDAPFKKNWEEMALKRLIHHAAEKGYHGIVVTPGAEQADRYSLAKHIDSIMLLPNPYPNKNLPYYFKAFDKQGNRVADDAVNEEKLQEYIGKEPAQQLLSSPANQMGERMISGANIVTGGEGMKAFYDKKLVNILNSIGKKHKVKTKLHAHKLEHPEDDLPAINEANAVRAQHGHPPVHQATLHHFPITEEMRKDVLTNGLPLYAEGGIIHKAQGGNVQPTITQMRLALNQRTNPYDIQQIGVNEAPDVDPKPYLPPSTDWEDNDGVPPGGLATLSGLPVGGVDMSVNQPGRQMMAQQPQQGPQQGPQPGANAPQLQDQTNVLNAPPSNILQMTPQGQAMNAMKPPAPPGIPVPPGMAKGGSMKDKSVKQMKAEMAEMKQPTRLRLAAEGPGGVKGIVVPYHMWHGSTGVYESGDRKGKTFFNPGMKHINKARAKVYGSENRDPLDVGKIGRIHKDALDEHFSKSLDEQKKAENEALGRLREAMHIKPDANTLDESEKLDTVHHEHDEEGRSHVGFASKGVAGRALYTSGYGKNEKKHVVNTCPGQTEGCGGGLDEHGYADTLKGTCFAPKAEQQYVNASVRRACHEQAKHDPAMTRDWILAHTGSLREAARLADKNSKRLLFRPNVVDETDTSSRHVIRHLNEQRKQEDDKAEQLHKEKHGQDAEYTRKKPPIISNSYGKTTELHDPENGYYVTHSNVGPKVKKGEEISENISRDKARVGNTVLAENAKGDFVNEQGHKTPPKGSYLVTDVKRGSPMAKKMEEHITHAKYWGRGIEIQRLSKEEREEGPEGHFDAKGKPTTPEKAHYGHITITDEDGQDRRYDYQKQHILHPRLVNVPERKKNKETGVMETVDHMIPTDSRFKDTEFLPENRYKSKNGKEAGHILMTTPTESTSNIGHETSFTHHVGQKHIEHAIANKGEYEIDPPHEQEAARGKEYSAPKEIKIVRKAEGGSIGGRHPGLSDDDFHAFPESNIMAQRHLAMRYGDDEERPYKAKPAKVAVHKDLDTMRLELTKRK